jgi:ribose transport system substrate-binding protein
VKFARHNRFRKLLSISALLCGITLVVSACGGSSGGTSSSSTGGTSTGSASTSSKINIAAFETQLQTFYKGTFTLPPTTAPAPPKNVNLWIISCGQASQGCSAPVAAAKAAAQVLGWKVNVFDGNFGIGDAYDAGLRQAIAAHATAIITVGVDCDQAKPGYQAAKAAGIAVIGDNSFDCNDPLLHDGPALFSATVKYTPQDPTADDTLAEVGAAKADWIIVHTHGEAQVINLDFSALTGGVATNNGFVAEMAKCSTCKILKTIDFSPADTSDGELKTEFASALAQYPQANAADVLSDGIIIQDGLAQALQSTGRTKTFALVGDEGYAPNVQLIRNQDGEDAGAPYDSNWLSWGAVDTVIRILDHQTAVDEGPGVQVIDASHNLPVAGQNYGAPVNYQALYKKAWGISS